MKFVLVYLCAIAAATLWIDLFVPLIANLFGIRYKFAFWRYDRRNQHLPRRQYFWFVGVLGAGGGLSVLFLLLDFLEWRFLGEKLKGPKFMAADLLIPLIVGAIYGSRSAPKEGTATEGPR